MLCPPSGSCMLRCLLVCASWPAPWCYSSCFLALSFCLQSKSSRPLFTSLKTLSTSTLQWVETEQRREEKWFDGWKHTELLFTRLFFVCRMCWTSPTATLWRCRPIIWQCRPSTIKQWWEPCLWRTSPLSNLCLSKWWDSQEQIKKLLDIVNTSGGVMSCFCLFFSLQYSFMIPIKLTDPGLG